MPLPLPRSILSIAALQRGLYTVVATSLIGSILSNLLLVLGEWQDFSGMGQSLPLMQPLLPLLLSVLLLWPSARQSTEFCCVLNTAPS